MTNNLIIQKTKKWINEVVVGCNFCPFAAKVVKQNTIHYAVESSIDTADCLERFLVECHRLDSDTSIETTLVIFSNAFEEFDEYLALVDLAEKLLIDNRYEGIYQVASFHPRYQFAGANENDAANYTNRSLYPMLHLLREESIEKALENYPDPESIPERNIRFAHEKGVEYMKRLWNTSREGEFKSL
ncbi:MAG: DUF1415 domain-containing protein [Chitinophagaceae bacterium]